MTDTDYNNIIDPGARSSNVSLTATDISLLHYIQKLIDLPELTNDKWTNNLINILEDYLSSNQQKLLIAYVDRHTSSLQLLHAIPPIFSSNNNIYSLCYLIRKNDSPNPITSIDEFLKHIRFGYVNGKSIPCLTALVSTLFGPLFMNNTNVQDMIKNDFVSELNQFLATFYERQYKDILSITYLFIPKDGLDKSVEELVKDKALITRFEAVMVTWHHQLKHVLLIQDRLMSIEDQSIGIHEEIHFWQGCLTDLHNIRKQLQRTELQNIIHALIMSKSAYIQQFLQAEKELQNFTEYVEDCLQFLKLLAEPSLQLNSVALEQLKPVIIDIFYRILIAWHHSKFFAIAERIKLIISKIKILDRYSAMSRLSLDKIIRLRVISIITKEVHGRDIIDRLIKTQTMDLQSFEWQMQLRFYWERHEQTEDCIIRQTITKFNYNYEYLGCASRLVISPLTDRCYITLTTALHLFRGGSSKGPAGTGKTETIKDLGKNFGIYVIVQNCSEALDYKSMGKMFSGFAQSGTWGCFDEFNRINIEVLSVVAQQIHSILTALSLKQKRFVFEGKEIPLLPQIGIFITMNPGYAGRTELPDNLKSMFRPVSMVVPDSIYIAENFLFSEGFQNTKNLARKVYTLYQLSAQQLSKQDHYDFGLRSLTAVLRYAGEKKRTNSTMTDDEVLLLSMLDMNSPKMTAQDLPLFRNIVEDLFPGINIPKIDYSKLIEAIEYEMNTHNLQITQTSIEKVIELYETHNSRHSVMLVGKTLSGKTTTWKLFKYALITLNKRGFSEYNKVMEYPINPKAVSLGELYGQFNLATNEWNDGILSTIMRQVCADEKLDKKLILFDAPIDTSWIESMNSLMDDNKLLTLANGERISLSVQVTLLFETEDLSTASPATVSRAGIVYCDYEKLGWKPYFESWLKQKISQDLRTELSNCVTKYLEPVMKYKHMNCKELVPIHELNGIISLTKLFDTFWNFNEIQMQSNEGEIISGRLIEMWFVFCLIWSIGASVDDEGRKKIDMIFRETEGTFPNKDTVFEFYVDTNNQTWLHWEEQLKEEWIYNSEIPFYKMIVPTVDTIRYEYLIRHLLLNKHQVLLVGAVGTGKTTVAENVLKKFDSDIYNILIVHMSAQTTSKMLQDILESNLEKRAKNLFVPMNGKKMIAFIDDMNMPTKDTYGFQPPLELIRTWIDYEFWYDRKIQSMKFVKDMYLLTAMGPPGGGRQQISRRLQSRFNLINMTFPFEHEICRIFGTMLSQKLHSFDDDIKYLDQTITKATVDLYQTIEKKYLPTPTKIHYTFNMRDISRMFEGLLLCHTKVITNKVEFLRLWIHEAHRVYSDRFMTNNDHDLFIKILSEKLAFYFDQVYHNVCHNREAPIYSDIIRTDGVYEEIRDYEKLKSFLEQTLQRYNKTALMLSMDLVMFRDAIFNICRIVRVLRRPRGNLLLLGIGGSGRQSLVRLAAFICDIVMFQIEIGRHYGHAEFKEDLRRLMKLCSISNREVVFLFIDTQIIDTFFLEDINALLHTGEVPNLFRNEDIQEIRNQLSSTLSRQGILDTNLNIMQFFYNRVKSNLHMAICMSPFGETFRNYIRMYPALVNCTTVIYFSEWPHEALIDVAYHFLRNFNFGLENNGTIHRTLANLCAFIHLSSKTLANRMKDELRREIYITPTNYLQFVSNYSRLFESEKRKLQHEYNRLQMGIIKVAETREKVAEISLELEKKKVLVTQLQRECEEFLGKIVEQKNSASERERQVQAFGIRIGEEEIRCQTIAAAAHEELTEAEPLLIKANEALEQLTKRDIGEVKAYIHPPSQVEKVMKALMILKGKEDTWEEAKKDLANVDFIKTLIKFPKDDITDRTLRRMQPFINDSELIPEKLKGVSSAASALCTWIRAVESYARVYRIVQPKKERYQKALFELNEKQNLLQQSKNELINIQTKIETLRLDYEMKMKEKDTLQRNADETAMFLDRATKLLDGVAEKRIIWDMTSSNLNENLDNLLGNSLLACAFLSYMGPFLSDYRDEIVHQIWEKELIRNGIHFKTDFNFANFMTTATVVREWNIQGLPRDNFSTENAILATRTLSYSLYSNKRSPLIFILSPGVDPAPKLQQLAEDKMMAQSRYYTLSLGQGQAPTARKLLEAGMKKGHWVFLANCHLSISWLPELDKIVEQLQTAAVHNDFRLWLSSSPTLDFPISILQIGLKITNEPQKGIKANMKRLYELITPEQFQRVKQGEKYRKLLFALTFFHSTIIERNKFLQLGWNVHYTFNDSDFQISENLLAIYLDIYDKTPFDALKYLITIVIYGGHCTDEWDMRLLHTYINSYIRDEVLDVMYYKLSSLSYYYMPRDGTFKSYKDFINSMPTTDHSEAFGQHPNADVASQIQESKTLFDTLLAVLPQKSSATVEKEVENEVAKAASEMLKLMPQQVDIEAVKKYMLIDTSPLSVVLLQEAERYNTLLLNISIALNDLLKSIQGLVVMSMELDELFKCIYEGRLPYAWQRTYISLKRLPAWFQDLRQRMNFFNSWVENQRQPIIFWISAFSYPTSFLTAVLQRTARKDQIAIDQLSWEFEVNKTEDKYLSDIDDGVYVTGLYLEGAGWDRKQGTLCEAQSMELVSLMPTIHFKPVEHKKKLSRGLYIAPCYYSSIRVGSFIIAIELKTGSMPPEHWIKRATALLMNLDN